MKADELWHEEGQVPIRTLDWPGLLLRVRGVVFLHLGASQVSRFLSTFKCRSLTKSAQKRFFYSLPIKKIKFYRSLISWFNRLNNME